MIIKGFKTLPELKTKLVQIPPEGRKAIVLVGRHPNEGTVAIANRHHSEWEKHGAVVVHLPREWTPHFLYKHYRKTFSVTEFERLARRIPSDDDVAKFLAKQGFAVPVVTFHGAPTGGWDGRIDYLTGQLHGFLPHLSKIPEHEVFSIHAAYKHQPPNLLVLEHFFQGTSPSRTQARVLATVHRTFGRDRFASDVFYPLLPRDRGQISDTYLGHYLATKRDVDYFSANLNMKFQAVLAHLVANGLKEKASLPNVPVWKLDLGSDPGI